MKKLFTFLVLIATIAINAQAPQGFNYQATVRNSSGQLLLNQQVSVKFNILKNSITGPIIYSETQTITTDSLGQISLVVGQGTPITTELFSAISWGDGIYYMEINLNTGSGYVAMGTTQLLSVPYALYANSSGNPQTPTANLASVLAVDNKANSLQIKNLADPTDVQDATTKSYTDASDTLLQTQIDSLNLASVLAVNNGANSLQIKNLADPTEVQDATTKKYTDASDALLQTQISSLASQLQTQITRFQEELISIQSQINGIKSPSVSIGTQTWTTTNLDVSTYNDNTVIPQVTDMATWNGLTTGAWCYYQFNSTNGTTYGKLYNWYAVAGIWNEASKTDTSLRKQLAPPGYHIPTDTEWTTLFDYLGGGLYLPGEKMRDTNTLWTPTNSNDTNSSGFSGLPGGYCDNNGDFNFLHQGGFWWSSSENVDDSTNAYYRGIEIDQAYRQSFPKNFGFSVRLVLDTPN